MLPSLSPVPHLDLVFFGIEIFFLARNRIVFQQLEPVVDAVGARQRGGQRRAGLEHPGLAALQMIGQDVGRIDEEIRAIVIALGIGRQLVQILLQFAALGAPGEVGVGLREAELGEPLHQLRPGESLGEKDHLGMENLHFMDQPFPEPERLGVGIIDPENADALVDPEQHHVAAAHSTARRRPVMKNPD